MEENNKQKILDIYNQLLSEQIDFLKESYYKMFAKLDEQSLRELYMTYYVKTRTTPSFVYFIYNKYTNLIKIGKTNNPYKRLNELKSMFKNHFGVDDALELIRIIFIPSGKDYTVEKMYHEKYKDFRTFGEWFKVTQEEIFDILPEFMNYDTDGFLKDEGFKPKIIFKDVSEYDYEIFALDTLDSYTLKIAENNKDNALYIKKLIADNIAIKYNETYYGFLGFDVRNLETSFSSTTNNDVWEMFKWLYVNRDKYALSTHYKIGKDDKIKKQVIGFNKDVEILDYYKLIEKMANDVCFIDFEY